MDPVICQAVARRQLLMFGYTGVVRVVAPHLNAGDPVFAEVYCRAAGGARRVYRHAAPPTGDP